MGTLLAVGRPAGQNPLTMPQSPDAHPPGTTPPACLVTGGAVRVGRAITLAVARAGHPLAFTYHRSTDDAASTLAEAQAFGVPAISLRCDQSDPAQIKHAMDAAEASVGPIGVLVNNAAVFPRTPVEQCTVTDWDAIQSVNLRAPWLFIQAALPGMRQLGAGCIINILDIATQRPYRDYLPYCASKAGLEALTIGLARTLGPAIRVNGVAPGTVDWPPDFPDAARAQIIRHTPLGRVGSPQDIAEAVVYLIGANFITGAVIPVDGGRSVG